MKSIFILAPVIVITGLYSLSAATQEVNATGKLSSVITIEQAIIQTLRHNSDLQSFSRNIDLAEENIDLAKSNYRVLLSPACSSFDQFNNFEERGNAFKKYILDYYKK